MSSLCFNQNSRNLDNVEDFPVQVSEDHRSFSVQRADKIHSTSGDFFERKMGLEIERKFQRWTEAEEASYFDELSAKAKAIIETEDIQLPTGELLERGGRLSPDPTWAS